MSERFVSMGIERFSEPWAVSAACFAHGLVDCTREQSLMGWGQNPTFTGVIFSVMGYTYEGLGQSRRGQLTPVVHCSSAPVYNNYAIHKVLLKKSRAFPATQPSDKNCKFMCSQFK